MTHSELNRVLQSARVPDRPAEYWREFPGAVVRRLRRGEAIRPELPRVRRLWPAWSLGLASACLLVGLGIGLDHLWPSSPGDEPLGPSLKLLRETSAMFPNSIRAIVADEAGVRLLLSERPDVPASDPLLIRVCWGTKCQSVLTFSGQTVEFAGVPLEVLADAQGHVLLVGDREVWSSADGGRPFAEGRVEARVLETVL